MDFLMGWGDEIALGAVVTLKVAFFSLILGLIWGMLGAFAQVSHSSVARKLGRAFTVTVRGTPELLIILLVYFGGTIALTKFVKFVAPEIGYIEVPPLQAGVFALSLVFGGYAAEVLRGAWLAVPVGNIEAALSLGMSPFTIFRRIRLPLMMRYALPGLGNYWISLIKDTSLISVVGLEEIMGASKMATSVTHEPFKFYAVAAFIYLAITAVNGGVLTWLEKRSVRGERRIAI